MHPPPSPSWLCYCKAMIGGQSGNSEAAVFSSESCRICANKRRPAARLRSRGEEKEGGAEVGNMGTGF